MNTHSGNGRKGDPEEILRAIEAAQGKPVLIPGNEETAALFQTEEAIKKSLPSAYEAALARVEAKGWVTPKTATPEQAATVPEAPLPMVPEVVLPASTETPLAEARTQTPEGASTDTVADTAPTPEATPLPQGETPAPEQTPISRPSTWADRPLTEEEQAAKARIDALTERQGRAESRESKGKTLEFFTSVLNTMEAKSLEGIKKGGAYSLEKYTDMGTWYNGQSTRTKLFVSVGLLGLAYGTAGTSVGAAALAGISVNRVLKASAAMIATEALLKGSYVTEEGEDTRTERTKKFHKMGAVAMSLLVLTGAMGSAGANILHDIKGLVSEAPQVSGGKTPEVSKNVPIKESVAPRVAPISEAPKTPEATISPEKSPLMPDAKIVEPVLHQGVPTEPEASLHTETHEGATVVEPTYDRDASRGAMPSEINPGDQEKLKGVEHDADVALKADINQLFSKPGIFGFGRVDGINSPSWKDPQVGFAHKNAADILGARGLPERIPPGTPRFGIGNARDIHNMQEYLAEVRRATSTNPLPNETIEQFIKRAMIKKIPA